MNNCFITDNYDLEKMYGYGQMMKSLGITNSTSANGERLDLVMKINNVSAGAHTVKLRWRAQSGATGTAPAYRNTTLEVQEL